VVSTSRTSYYLTYSRTSTVHALGYTSTVGINTYILILRCFRKSVLNTSLSVRRRNSDAAREMKHQGPKKKRPKWNPKERAN
jgi:hypothetical protein